MIKRNGYHQCFINKFTNPKARENFKFSFGENKYKESRTLSGTCRPYITLVIITVVTYHLDSLLPKDVENDKLEKKRQNKTKKQSRGKCIASS